MERTPTWLLQIRCKFKSAWKKGWKVGQDRSLPRFQYFCCLAGPEVSLFSKWHCRTNPKLPFSVCWRYKAIQWHCKAQMTRAQLYSFSKNARASSRHGEHAKIFCAGWAPQLKIGQQNFPPLFIFFSHALRTRAVYLRYAQQYKEHEMPK